MEEKMQTSTLATLSDLQVSALKDSKLGMKFGNIRGNGAQIHFKLDCLHIPFEPSVYNGTGAELRKGILLEISEADAVALLAFEEKVRQLTGLALDKWNSCVRQHDGNWRLKAKINMGGERACFFADGSPSSLRGCAAVAVVSVNGLYVQCQVSGLALDVVALRVGAKVTPDPPVWMKSLGF